MHPFLRGGQSYFSYIWGMNIRLTEEQKIRILNSEDVFNIMQQVLLRENKIRRNQEHFWIVGLDGRNKILFIELISLGAVNIVQVSPPEVFRMAIYKLAVKCILVHNHPSNDVQASTADKNLTDRLMKTGKLINIDVIDHLIISETDFLSFEVEGLMDELENSGMYEILDKEKQAMLKLEIEHEKEKALRESKLDMARKMKEDGVDIETIQKYTGLKKWDIKRL